MLAPNRVSVLRTTPERRSLGSVHHNVVIFSSINSRPKGRL